jgi:hypothetical protein
MAKKKHMKKSPKDNRVTLKFDKEFWDLVANEIDKHPEWGVKSVPDFVRRAVDNELSNRKRTVERKTIQIDLLTRGSQEGSHDRDS